MPLLIGPWALDGLYSGAGSRVQPHACGFLVGTAPDAGSFLGPFGAVNAGFPRAGHKCVFSQEFPQEFRQAGLLLVVVGIPHSKDIGVSGELSAAL